MAKNSIFFVSYVSTIALLHISIQPLMPEKLNLMLYVQLSIVLTRIWRNIIPSQQLLQLKSIHRLFQDYLSGTGNKNEFVINGVK